VDFPHFVLSGRKGALREMVEFNRNKERQILRNRAQCTECQDIIESKSTHDCVSCKCGNIQVDGGLSYLKRGSARGAPIELSELRPDFAAFPQVTADSWLCHPPGWDAIVLDALGKLSPGARVLQTKSKFGDMRFYIAGTEADIAVAAAAETAAYTTCSRCGGALSLEPTTESNSIYAPQAEPCKSCNSQRT
jgi:hypothetical protein